MKGIIDTSSMTYRQIMGNGIKYEIPKFQRDYTWETEHWDDLWQDIFQLLSEEETEHYMGYLVLQTTDNKNYQIIDGQQRLTTLSIIVLVVLKCLDDFIKNDIEKDSNQKRKETLHNSYIGTIDPVTLITNNKLKLNRNSDDYYRNYIVLLKDLPIRNTNASQKHMRECFNWYYDRIKKKFKTGLELAAFIDGIVDKLFFTVIKVSDQLNAFKVFETLNARGVQLSSSDLLKNYLFSIVDETKPHENEIEELEKLWSGIIGKLGSLKFEDYLRYYWNSSHKTVSKKNLFKTIKNEIKTKEQTFALLRDLLETVDLYIAISEPNDSFWNEFKEVKESLTELKMFQIKQTNSLLISAYKNLDKVEFLKLLKATVIISFRYNIIGGLNPNEQEEVYNTLALKINRDKLFTPKDLEKIYINDDNFLSDFSTKQFKSTTRNHRIVKYIYAKIEMYKYQHDIPWDSDIYTIEHILPESADEYWGGFNDEEINRSVYRLANLTLLEKKINNAASTLPFQDKVEIFKKSNSKLTQAISEHYENWNEDKISARQKQLAKEAKSIWRLVI
ncbi:MAG: DUF262 domain-containing protein [Bacteroidales bacterium]|nr:DUF262 domain-containing protein [Bacteroidales bacterium]